MRTHERADRRETSIPIYPRALLSVSPGSDMLISNSIPFIRLRTLDAAAFHAPTPQEIL
ncbi:MAG TPA: hypothetical protein VGB73_16805 [Pyrinomonadaceae bacterium]